MKQRLAVVLFALALGVTTISWWSWSWNTAGAPVVWIAHQSSNSDLTKLDGNTGLRLLSATTTANQTLQGCVFDGTNLWVTANANSVVMKISSTGTVLTTTAMVAGNPYGMAYDGKAVWASLLTGGIVAVVKISTTSSLIVSTSTIASNAEELAFDGANIWASTPAVASVTKILASTGAVVGTYAVSSTGGGGIAFDGTNIWNGGSILNAASGASIATYAVSSSANGMAWDPITSTMWVANSVIPYSVTKYGSDGSAQGTFLLGAGPPAFIASDGRGSIWVPAQSSSTVVRVSVTDGSVLSSTAVSSSPHTICPQPRAFMAPL